MLLRIRGNKFEHSFARELDSSKELIVLSPSSSSASEQIETSLVMLTPFVKKPEQSSGSRHALGGELSPDLQPAHRRGSARLQSVCRHSASGQRRSAQ